MSCTSFSDPLPTLIFLTIITLASQSALRFKEFLFHVCFHFSEVLILGHNVPSQRKPLLIICCMHGIHCRKDVASSYVFYYCIIVSYFPDVEWRSESVGSIPSLSCSQTYPAGARGVDWNLVQGPWVWKKVQENDKEKGKYRMQKFTILTQLAVDR